MSDLDTEIEGEVANVRAVARWLRGDLKSGFSDHGTAVGRQRNAAAGDWQGDAGTAFGQRARTLVVSSEDGASHTEVVAQLCDDVAEDLRTALEAMEGVRSRAREGELTVDGHWVRDPGQGPPAAGPSPTGDVSQAEVSAWEAKDQAVREHNQKVEVWNRCVEDADEAHQAWIDALDSAGSLWERYDTQYAGLTAGLLGSAFQLEVVRRVTPVMVGQVDEMITRAEQLRAHADALKTPSGHVVDPPRYYDLLDEAQRLDDAVPPARANLPSWELPRGLTRGLAILDVAAAGYGIYSDWDEEGPTQAIVSNAVPAAAGIASGMAAGAYIGGVAGSFIPIPGVGTAIGIVGGAVVGGVVGAFTSGAIDSMFDNGITAVGDAVSEGWNEVEEMGSSIADGAGAVADGIGNAFDSIF